MGGSDDETQLLTTLSENCPGRFLDLAMHDMPGKLVAVRDYFSEIASGRFAPALSLSLSIMEASGSHRRKQRRSVAEALELVGFWLAQLMRTKAGVADALGLPDYTDALRRQAAAFDRGQLLEASRRIEDAIGVVRFNVDMRLLLDTTFLGIATTLHPL
jgi:hypothetical protein